MCADLTLGLTEHSVKRAEGRTEFTALEFKLLAVLRAARTADLLHRIRRRACASGGAANSASSSWFDEGADDEIPF